MEETKQKKQTTKRTIREFPKLSEARQTKEHDVQNPSQTHHPLVGRIMEKGFSSTTSTTAPLPQPTVLPFPVARHRSHGPHWAPVSNDMEVDNDNEYRDDTDFYPIADFANPIPRKQKKSLNFSRWRELTAQDSSIVKQVSELSQSTAGDCNPASPNPNGFRSEQVNRESHLHSRKHQNTDGDDAMDDSVDMVVGSSVILADKVVDESFCFPVQENIKGDPSMFLDVSLRNSQHEQGFMSLENEIDAENRARLQQMSSNEIAEAQAEVMEKMKPGLLEMLKKRGERRPGKSKIVTSDLVAGHPVVTPCNKNDLTKDARSDPLSQDSRTHASSLRPSCHSHGVPDGSGTRKTAPPSNNLWNTWSKRVEAARAFRFALDGSVLESNFMKISDSDKLSDGNQHNVNVAERDFLRTEGDPGATGYTIKEAVELCRSTVPGQRALALQLLTSVLDKTFCEMKQSQVGGGKRTATESGKFVDWEAIWAYSLGPEPELALSVRMALDDNHISVVLASVRAIHSILCCDMVENFFDVSEKLAIYDKGLYTSPIFRAKPGINGGFLHGGFWKYNTKPSNIIPTGDMMVEDEREGKHTIQDDIFVAGQDFAAGLIRMGILPRICHLLETNPSSALEEYLISVLVALARHSPTCAYAIIRCPRLVQTIVDRFILKEAHEIHHSKIKAVILLKVLAQSAKKNCVHLTENGIFRVMMWHFCQHPLSLEQWIKSGAEYCKLMSALMVEQLRLWKVCIQYGYCISYFPDFFPFLCLWLSPPNIDKLIESNVLVEFASITREAYLVVEALARRLPNLHSGENLRRQGIDSADHTMEAWSWSHVSPLVESALKWISLKSNPHLTKFVDEHESTNIKFVVPDSYMSCFLCVISAIMHMLSSILNKVIPEGGNALHGTSGRMPWLPEFVPKIGLEIINNRFLSFSRTDGLGPSGVSFAMYLCDLQLCNDDGLSLSLISCLHGLVELIVSLDKSIELAKKESYTPSSKESFSREGKILEDGIVSWSRDELRRVLITFMTSVSSGWRNVQFVEKLGRGGPAPGVGVGWGAPGGGFWSTTVLLEQTAAQLLMKLHVIFPIVLQNDNPTIEHMTFTLQKINSVLGLISTLGPRDTTMVEKAFDFLLQSPVLKYLYLCIQHFLPSREIKAFGWEYGEDEYICFSKILQSHFRDRWLSVKRKSKAVAWSPDSDQNMLKGSNTLETIHEDLDTSDVTVCDAHCTSLAIEWAHQRLPLPLHWFLSPISTAAGTGTAIDLYNASNIEDNIFFPLDDLLEVAKGGLFFLLGLEAVSNFPCTAAGCSPVQAVPLVWKLHCLSAILLVCLGVLREDKSRDVYRALQDLYGQLLDESRNGQIITPCPDNNENLAQNRKERGVESLKFQSDVHDSYLTFIETLVENFGADSLGDVLYGRQIAIYLHLCVESPVRLAAWNALSNADMLQLLPPLDNCFAEAEGYLGIENNESILEAYAKSWVSGRLDNAASRGSMSFTLALHHLSSFIFQANSNDQLVLRNKLTKSLLRDYSRKLQHEPMMLDLLYYNKGAKSQKQERRDLQTTETERRFMLLTEACEGDSTLLTTVEKLGLLLQKDNVI